MRMPEGTVYNGFSAMLPPRAPKRRPAASPHARERVKRVPEYRSMPARKETAAGRTPEGTRPTAGEKDPFEPAPAPSRAEAGALTVGQLS